MAFGIGAVNGYIFNRRWTFGARDTSRGVGMGEGGAYLATIPPVTVAMFLANRA